MDVIQVGFVSRKAVLFCGVSQQVARKLCFTLCLYILTFSLSQLQNIYINWPLSFRATDCMVSAEHYCRLVSFAPSRED
jgi:hypothetical protein